MAMRIRVWGVLFFKVHRFFLFPLLQIFIGSSWKGEMSNQKGFRNKEQKERREFSCQKFATQRENLEGWRQKVK